MIKLIYFDFGGVLINFERFFQKVCFDFSLNYDDFLKFYDQFDNDVSIGKMTTEEFWTKCIEKYNLKNAENYDLPKSWVSDYDIIQPINDLIYSLENKINIGIISNIGSGIWEAAVKYEFVPNIKYKKVYLSCNLKLMKPNLEIYRKIQEESGVKANEILFVDDKKENLIIPSKMGWKTILFDRFKAEEGVNKIKKIIYVKL
jgi:putative hydrolase of the HAD superfamily